MIIRALERARPSMRDIDPKGRLKCAMRGLCWLLNVLEGGGDTASPENQLGTMIQPWATSLVGVPTP